MHVEARWDVGEPEMSGLINENVFPTKFQFREFESRELAEEHYYTKAQPPE